MDNNSIVTIFGTFVIITSALFLLWYSVNGIVEKRAAVRKQEEIIRQAEKRIPIYRVSVYNVDQYGQISWMVGVKEFDSIFKVAQYAPDNFKEWAGGWNNLYEGDDVNEFIRYYDSDSDNKFALVVRVPNVIGNDKAIAYLLHL